MLLIPEVSCTPVGPEAGHTHAPGSGSGRAAWPPASPVAAQHEELAVGCNTVGSRPVTQELERCSMAFPNREQHDVQNPGHVFLQEYTSNCIIFGKY